MIIPSYFKAYDGYSNPVRAMAATTMQFEKRLHALGAGSERAFRRATNIFDNTTSSMFDYAKSMAAVGAAVGGVIFSGGAILDYQDQLASFRTIVSDLSDTDFGKFRREIASVAHDQRKSMVAVTQNFEMIAGLNAEYAKTARGLGDVSAASIVLSKASRMELGPAAEDLVGIMNQYNFAADQAMRTTNALAAGQAVGAANIQQTAMAMQNFGATAAGANVSLEESIALVQTMAKYGQIGNEAGTRLRSAVIKVQESGMGYKSGRFNLVEGLDSIRQRYESLSSARAKDAYLTKVFGMEQITAGRILVSNTDLIKQFTQEVTGTDEAMRAARINTSTLRTKLGELRDEFVNQVVDANSVNMSLNILGSTVEFLTDHMGLIVGLAAPVVGALATWRIGIWGVQAAAWATTKALVGLNFVQGVGTVITGQYATACFATSAGMRGMAFASFFLERGLWGSLGIITLATAAVGVLGNHFSYAADKARYLRGELKLTKDGITESVPEMSDAAIALDLYTQKLKEYQKSRQGALYDLYMMRNHPFRFFIESAITRPGGAPTGTTEMPQRKDFPGLNGVDNRKLDSLERQFIGNDTAKVMDNMRMSSVNNIQLNVTVDKSGNVSATSSGANIMPGRGVRIEDSGSFNKGSYG